LMSNISDENWWATLPLVFCFDGTYIAGQRAFLIVNDFQPPILTLQQWNDFVIAAPSLGVSKMTTVPIKSSYNARYRK